MADPCGFVSPLASVFPQWDALKVVLYRLVCVAAVLCDR